MKVLLITLILFFSVSEIQNEMPLTISIAEMNSKEGNIVLAVYTSHRSYKDNEPLKKHVFPKQDNMQNGVFKCTIELPEGQYGIAFHDDENADGKMNYNIIGIPKEGYGYSNFYHSGIFPPKYADFEFTFNKNTSNLDIKLRYF